MDLNPLIPAAPQVSTWTRFIHQFEPYEFNGWVRESESWKTTAYVGDWSPLPNKIIVKGPDALKFFQDISVNSFEHFEVGTAKHSIQCDQEGNIVCEGVLMRLAEDELKFTSGPLYWAEYQFAKGDYDATLTQRGTDDFIIQVQGPSSLQILEKVTGSLHREHTFMQVRQIRIGDADVWCLRQGMSGELGFELHGDGKDAIAVHEALLAAGEEFGVERLGGRTKMVNHVEACFPTPVVDFLPAYDTDPEFRDYLLGTHPELGYLPYFPVSGSHAIRAQKDLYRNPTELGWGNRIKFDHEFIGREALEVIVANQKRSMVTLVWNDDDVKDVYGSLFDKNDVPYETMELPRALFDSLSIDSVQVDGVEIGVSTSRCYSYHFREMLSLCSIDLAYVAPGTEVSVIWGSPGSRQKAIRATVARAPYKTDNRRIDTSSIPLPV
ncbi:MAG TPA: hypothetical protein VNT50_09955 [Microbacterium sp.]|nr:hypothetical protein [Microbacterium sp.]